MQVDFNFIRVWKVGSDAGTTIGTTGTGAASAKFVLSFLCFLAFGSWFDVTNGSLDPLCKCCELSFRFLEVFGVDLDAEPNKMQVGG